MIDEAIAAARSNFVEQELLTLSASDVQDFMRQDRMLSVEMMFVWGWLHEHAALRELPTTASMRATVFLVAYLQKFHDMDFETARIEASEIDALWNRADPLFEAIQRAGARSYPSSDEAILHHVVSVLAGASSPETR